jgi:hypothetical protein
MDLEKSNFKIAKEVMSGQYLNGAKVWGFYLLMMIIVFIFYLSIPLLTSSPITTNIITILTGFVIAPVMYGISRIFLENLRTPGVKVESFLSGFKEFFRIFKLQLLIFVITLPLLIPSFYITANAQSHSSEDLRFYSYWYLIAMVIFFYISIRAIFMYFIMLDYPELNAFQTIKKSFALTKGRFFYLFGSVILFILISICSVFLLLIPMFWFGSIWMSFLASVYERSRIETGEIKTEEENEEMPEAEENEEFEEEQE